ncbi:MAG TPA: transglycosylase SLT domain-containing protein [Methylomirabilota bacterium]|nr:transglycosylase SLT domain-containing protein [Methylomirabilota bacterium]
MLSRYREPLRAWTDPIGHALFRLRLRPNHLTLAGLGVSLLAAGAFVVGRTRIGGVLLILAGLFDFFDGSLARASGQVTPFGAFLDSVIDRYSDLVVLLGIVVLFAGMPHARGAIIAMAGLVGSVMVSYTKARAESIGVECTVGMMERPERMICLIAGAVLDLLEPALWVLAVLANFTALQRIAFTWRATRSATVLTFAGMLLLTASPASATAASEAPPERASPAQSGVTTLPPTPEGRDRVSAPAAASTAIPGPAGSPSPTQGAATAEPAQQATSAPAASASPNPASAIPAEPATNPVSGTPAAENRTPTGPPPTSGAASEISPPAGSIPDTGIPAETPGLPAPQPAGPSAPAASSPARTAPPAAAVTAPAVTPADRPIATTPAPAVAPETERAWARAIEAYAEGDPRPALREFATPAALGGPIGDHLGLLLADARERVGDLAGARAAALGVADRYRDSRLAPGALVLATTLAFRTRDEAAAQAVLVRLISSYPDAPETPGALYLLGMTGEARGELAAAAAAYRELRVIAPASGWADGAEDRLALLTAAGVRVPELSVTQRLDRAERLLRGGVPKTASDEAERIVNDSRDPSVIARAFRVVADASARLGQYEVAARALEALAARSPAVRRPTLWLEQARLLVRAGRRDRALAVLTEVEARGAESEAAEATYLRGRVLDDLDRQPQASTAYAAVASRHPNREVAGAALWRLGWLAHARNDMRAAERAWLKVTQISGGRGYRVPALYWAGRMRERTSGRAAAADMYRKVLAEAPRSYYGTLAARRVAAPGPAGTGPPLKLPADPRQALGDDPGFLRVELLRRIGLVEAAAQELDDVVLRSVGDPVRLYGLSGAFVRDERYHVALRILRRHFATVASTGHDALPRAFWEMLYPFPWRDEIAVAAQRNGLDPNLVAAVVREESSYYPRAVSRTGARGLMQLMPATAQPMAAHRGLAFREGNLLDDPRANIQLGTAFLAGLMREWNDARLALAAYNAGPRRVRDWWKARRTSDVEAFVELIPFDETRHYVKRVMLSWDEYRRLYEAAGGNTAAAPD